MPPKITKTITKTTTTTIKTTTKTTKCIANTSGTRKRCACGCGRFA